MKRFSYHFTLVEMLTVIAVIAILAAIITPVVIISRTRGMVSRAESDITSIMAALKALEAKHHRVISKDNKIGGISVTPSDGIVTLTGEAYDAMIAELTVPKNSGLAAVSVNKSGRGMLDPRKDFDPTVSYKNQLDKLYRDPWGTPYKIMVKVTKDNELKINDSKTIIGNYAVYSFGPEGSDKSLSGIDNGGCNADHRMCSDPDCKHDDIASWNL